MVFESASHDESVNKTRKANRHLGRTRGGPVHDLGCGDRVMLPVASSGTTERGLDPPGQASFPPVFGGTRGLRLRRLVVWCHRQFVLVLVGDRRRRGPESDFERPNSLFRGSNILRNAESNRARETRRGPRNKSKISFPVLERGRIDESHLWILPSPLYRSLERPLFSAFTRPFEQDGTFS